MSNVKAIKFGPIVRFRVLSGDLQILRAAAERAGQTVSAYLREAAIGKALDDYGVPTREAALKRLGKQKLAPLTEEAPARRRVSA